MLADGEIVTEADLAGRDGSQMPVPTPGRGRRCCQRGRACRRRCSEIEREHIVRTLEQVRGNKAVAARLLGISRRAFYRQLERHGLHQRVPAAAPRDSGGAERRERL